MYVIIILFTTPEALTNITCMSQYTTTVIIVFGCGLSILFVLLIVVFAAAICIFIRSKKKPQRESVYYDTIHHTPTQVVETKLNVAYRHPKKLK